MVFAYQPVGDMERRHVERRHCKLRMYFLLIACSALVFIVLYKTLTTEEQESESHVTPKGEKKPKAGTLVNINALLTVTQPAEHLKKQRLKEAEFHANIRKNFQAKTIAWKDPVEYQLDNMPGKDDVEIDHPGISLNARVSKGLRVPKPGEIIPIERKIVHLDLKGAPPIVSYYKKLFPLLQSLGATGILLEYEDMFPFQGSLESLSAHNAYSRNEVSEILHLAKANGLDVIPLVQTFGHMEFVLKLSSYQSLREVPAYPQVICPSNNASQILIRQIIDQIVVMHPGLKWLHIGSDEVYYIGECNLCQHKMEVSNMNKDELFLFHIKGIARYIKEKYSIQPIMWDDMFRRVPEEVIKKSEIWKNVDLMVWQYGPSVEMKIPPETWQLYGKYFPGIWVASAYKGATGPNQYLTNISYHLENHVSWLAALSKYHHDIFFQGFVLTGWQRYDHFAVLCELLPVSIPSLAVNLIFLRDQQVDMNLLHKTREALFCDSRLTFSVNFSIDEVLCNFPGSNVFKGAQKLAHLKFMLEKMLSNSNYIGWMNDYNVHMFFSSPAHVELGTQNLEALFTNASLLYTFMQNTMPEVYDKYTIDEWLQTYVYPLVVQIDKIRTSANTLLKFHTWPRRPLSQDSLKSPVHVF